MAVRHDGESISRGQLDRRAADARALRDVLWFVAVFAGSVFINGILFMTVDPIAGRQRPASYTHGPSVTLEPMRADRE